MSVKLKPLLKNSWNIVWHNPLLWLFGFFAALFANNEINVIIANFNRINNWIDQLITLKVIKTQFNTIFTGIQSQEFFTATALYNISLGLIIFLFFLYLSITSQIALVLSVKKIHTVKTRLTLTNIWKKSKTFFWPILGLYFLVLVITYGFLYLLSFPFLYTLPIPIITYIIIFLILVFCVTFISRFAIFYIILKNNRIINSFKNASLFFFKNFSIVIKTSVILFIILIVVGLGVLLVSIGASFPFLTLMSLFLYIKFMFGFWFTLIAWTFILLIFFAVISSIFSSFQTSVWILLFSKLSKKLSS
ncbi:hypothetical protein MYX06_00955 [Patescibacteria group bacterium AH-259-L05]|nr:hypothetical protein [Patescibacteria group bacterium AH-259-L05]